MKKTLRAKYNTLRKEITENQRFLRSEAIVQHIINHQKLKSARTLMLYHPLPDEPDISSLIDFFIKNGKEVYLPVVREDRILPVRIFESKDLKPGFMGIMEPTLEDERPFSIPVLDIIFVPGVAFSNDGQRLGRGGGHYDKFLKDREAWTIGVCYSEQLCSKLPEEEHDIRLDQVITDEI
ncbi:MAG: 5-formyltetrahydrofolate cyclo-ligase [Elusimicrobia bacterium]|nr:5-formyltetrahydrofolate cyclo-ligase [Elusimicrobiota bacterium]